LISSAVTVGSEMEAFRLDVALQIGVQPDLVNRRAAAVEGVHDVGAEIHAGHDVAEVGEADGTDKTDIPGPDNCDIFCHTLLDFLLCFG
jgi:hypothetical protein